MPQNPDAEPVNVLLERTKEEISKLDSGNKAKNKKMGMCKVSA